MTVEEIRKFINYVANKHQTGKTFTGDQYNDLLPRAVDDFIRQRYGLPQDWRAGFPVPQMGWEVAQQIKDDLKTLLVNPLSITVTGTGQYVLPADYWHHSSLRHSHNKLDACGDLEETFEVDVEIVADNEIGVRLSSRYKQPSSRYPIAAYYDTYIQFYPEALGDAIFTYLKYPDAPVWGFTIVNDEEVYDVGTSTQVDLPDSTHIEICRIILSYVAVNLTSSEIQQYAETKIIKGV